MKRIKEQIIGKARVRLVQNGNTFAGIIINGDKISKRIDGDNQDEVWGKLINEVGTTDPQYFGFEGAINKFLREFPDGFAGQDYLDTERDYKIEAKEKLDKVVPLEFASTCKNIGVDVLRVFQATNVVFSVEKARLSELLKGPNADAFIQASAAFTSGGGAPALKEIAKLLKQYNVANWTAATYLPYLWKPEEHMFLKPEVTKDYAARIGHSFQHDYQSSLEYEVYESLLDLTAQTTQVLKSKNLNPRDNIDIQSFIWVIGGN